MVFGVSKFTYSGDTIISIFFTKFIRIWRSHDYFIEELFYVISNIYTEQRRFQIMIWRVSQSLVAHGDNIIKTEHFNCCDDMAMSAYRHLVIPIQYTIR